MMKTTSTLFLTALIVLASACSPVSVATGVGATTGIAAAKEGGIKQSFTDARISVNIQDAWFQYDVGTFTKLNLNVSQGRVLVTGVVQDPKDRLEAIRLVWTVSGVQQVINEVQVAESEGITGYAKDTWITTRLRAQMTLNREIQSINYSLETVQGTIYLMGIAQDQEELNRVIEVARTIPNVRQVVSYVKMAGPAGDAALADPSPEPQSQPAEPISYDDSTYKGGAGVSSKDIQYEELN